MWFLIVTLIFSNTEGTKRVVHFNGDSYADKMSCLEDASDNSRRPDALITYTVESKKFTLAHNDESVDTIMYKCTKKRIVY